jgi:hypothetical protein
LDTGAGIYPRPVMAPPVFQSRRIFTTRLRVPWVLKSRSSPQLCVRSRALWTGLVDW